MLFSIISLSVSVSVSVSLSLVFKGIQPDAAYHDLISYVPLWFLR